MAPAVARAALESLLRTRKLDTTLTTALPSTGPDRADRAVPIGHEALDRSLGGGIARGQISEITGLGSTGRTALVHALLAGTTARGELAACIDPLDRFDVASAVSAGVVLERLLWVRGEDVAGTQPALDPAWEPSRARPGQERQTPIGRAVSRALKATALVLSAGGFGVVVLDLADVPRRVLGALPFTTWLRLQRLIASSDTACVLIADLPLARSAGGATVRLEPRPVNPAARAVAPSVAPRFRDRPGGYTRIVKLGRHRIGDGTELCVIQFVGAEEGPEIGGNPSSRRRTADKRTAFAAKVRKEKSAAAQ